MELRGGVRGDRCIEVVIVGEVRGVFSVTACSMYIFIVFYLSLSFNIYFYVDIIPNYRTSY